MKNRLYECIKNKDTSYTPIWFMRQAGRYLPEFREIRKNNQDFIKLCLNPELVNEITLQPLKRFNIDAAIIFSDILMVPFALGQNVEFIKDYGPKLSDFNINNFLDNDKISFTQKLHPVYKAIEITRNKLDKEKSLISFIGAPWTLLIYMLNLKKSKKEIKNIIGIKFCLARVNKHFGMNMFLMINYLLWKILWRASSKIVIVLHTLQLETE